MKNQYIVILVLLLSSLFAKSNIVTYNGTLINNGTNWFLKSEAGFFILDLAPEEFMNEQGLNLEAGDEARVSGIIDGKDLIVNVIISKGKVVVMRDGEGNSLWQKHAEKIHFVLNSKCIGCRLCIADCPVNAIVMYKGKAVIDADACINCGICKDGNENFLGCPSKAIILKEIEEETIEE